MTDQANDNPPTPEKPENPLGPEKLVIGGKKVYGNGTHPPRSYGSGIRKYASHMGHKTEEEIRRIADNPRLPIVKRTAAAAVLRAAKMDPVGIALLHKLIEHTDGTAIKRVEVQGQTDQAVRFVEGVFGELASDVQTFLVLRGNAQPPRKIVGPDSDNNGGTP